MAQTQTIIDGIIPAGEKIADVQVVTNLIAAWQYILNTQQSFDLEVAKQINARVAFNEASEWGTLRTGNVTIGGVDYVPKVPEEAMVSQYIQKLMSRQISATEKAMRYMLWADRNQLFWDGNKRTSVIEANYLMIQAGAGVINIAER